MMMMTVMAVMMEDKLPAFKYFQAELISFMGNETDRMILKEDKRKKKFGNRIR